MNDDLTPAYSIDNQTLSTGNFNDIKIYTSLPVINLTISFSCLKCTNATTMTLYVMNDTQYTVFSQTGSIDTNVLGPLIISNYTASQNNTWTILGNSVWYIVVQTNIDSNYSLIISTSALTTTEVWRVQLQLLLMRLLIVLPLIILGLIILSITVKYLRRSKLIVQKESRKRALEQQFQTKL